MPDPNSLFARYNYVRQIPIFGKLNWFELHKIARKARVVNYSKGEIIATQGNPPDYLYCVISGRVQAFATEDSGHKSEVEFMRRGMHFGIISLLTGENHSLSFTAVNDSVVLKIYKDDFHTLLRAIPQLGVAFSQSLSQRLRRRAVKVKSIFESTIISVYSPVKESGSSTYAANLALSLHHQTKKKVVFVSISSFQRWNESAQMPPAGTSPLWKKAPVRLNEIADDHAKIMQNIISGGIEIDRLHVGFEQQDKSVVSQISQFVTSLVVDYHYVVVDLPNDMDAVVLKTLTQSDLVALLALERKEDLKMTRQVIDQIAENLKENFSADRVQVLINSREDIPAMSFEQLNKELDFDVYARLPLIAEGEITETIECGDLVLHRPAKDSQYAREITKIARQIGKVLVGLVLGGGAALGIAHIGVLKVLEEENIPIDIIVGSSMGALLAGLYATGRNPAEIARLAQEFETPKGMMTLVDPVLPISGFIGGKAIHRWLKKQFGQKTFYDTRIPLKIVAYDLMKRQDLVISSGLITEAIKRSIAIPGVIEPIVEQDRVIIDGGILNPLPTNVLTALGVNKIIAVNVLQSPDDVAKGYLAEQQILKERQKVVFWKSPVRWIKHKIFLGFKKAFMPNISDIIVSTLQATGYVLAEQSGQQADVMIHPDLAGINWFELYRVDELIARGEKATRDLLPKIRQVMHE